MVEYISPECRCCGEVKNLGQLASELWLEMDEDTQIYFFHNQETFLSSYWASQYVVEATE